MTLGIPGEVNGVNVVCMGSKVCEVVWNWRNELTTRVLIQDELLKFSFCNETVFLIHIHSKVKDLLTLPLKYGNY